MSHIAFSLSKSFDEEDLAMLTGVYMACCNGLEIPEGKSDLRRQTVAHVVMVLAMSGETNPRVLQMRTLMHLRMPA